MSRPRYTLDELLAEAEASGAAGQCNGGCAI